MRFSQMILLVGAVFVIATTRLIILYQVTIKTSVRDFLGTMREGYFVRDAENKSIHSDDTRVLNTVDGLSDCDIVSFDIIRNGTIFDEGEVVKQNGQVVDISGGDPKNTKSYKVNNAIYGRQTLGVLLHSHDATYYHALIQFGARFQYTIEHCRSRDVLWLIRGSPVQKKILALLNDPPILNLRIFHPKRTHSSQRVLIPPAPYRNEDLLSFRASILRRVLSPAALALADTPQRDGTTVFVRRVRRRAIRNEAEVLTAFMEAFPADLAYFHERDDHPLATTAAVFQSARRVLGGHGAGLANMLFCRPGARVF